MPKRKTKRDKTGTKLKRVSRNVGIFILEMLVNTPLSLAHAFLDQKSIYERIELEGYFIDRFSDRLKDLEKRGYIKIKNNSIEITGKGRIRQLENSNDKQRDGKWRILSWDIPESMKRQRNQFRRTIKRIGYRQVQRSLWASPYIKADEVDLAINEYGVRKYIGYFVVEKTDILDHLQRLFKRKYHKK